MKNIEQIQEKMFQENLKKLLEGKYVPASISEFADLLVRVDELNNKELRKKAKEALKNIDINKVEETKHKFGFRKKKEEDLTK